MSVIKAFFFSGFAAMLVSRGYAVHAFDLRGHGDSEGDRVWVTRFGDYLDDLGIFLRRVREQEPNKKVFLFGHSMGGAIVTLYTLTRELKPAGLIASSAAATRMRLHPTVTFCPI